ncbi:uncharacterized protein LOC107362250 [Tetranychus urticae]|uniref:Uncharacterized protein n=1 Tax=Tetranychus urticae TaxID=32264 RepID=T1KBI7_TETUR|nr:uncharacterized protein LOC107362250 [Tetranychus urticae]
MSKQSSFISQNKAKQFFNRVVSRGLIFPLAGNLPGFKRSKPSDDQLVGSKHLKLAPFTVPEDASPFLKLYAERYHTSIKNDPDNVVNIYNTVCFLILSLMDSKLDKNICQFLDSFTPIVNIKSHMDSFDDDVGMAMQRHRDAATILNYWQLGALRRYEFLKWHLIAVRSAELFLFFHRDQSNGFSNYINRFFDKQYLVTQSQLGSSTRITENVTTVEKPEIKCSLAMNNSILDLPLDEATSIVTSEKRKLETQIENFSLYLRCIRELIQINENNIAKIHSYQFRWRPTRLSERVQSKRIILNSPMSALHKAYCDFISRQVQNSNPS